MKNILGKGVIDTSDKNSNIEKIPKAVLVSCDFENGDEMDTDSSLDELEELVKTAGAECFCKLVQSREKPEHSTYIGKGKLEELAFICNENDIDLAVFDDELTPSQIANIESCLSNTRVIDRTMLILDIFAQRASTSIGMLQVEIAELKYTAPRLIGSRGDLSRLGGGIGTRGPGETKLEQDKRLVRKRIQKLEEELLSFSQTRKTQRKMREKNSVFQMCLAGYTNAGKSTLLNKLCDDSIFAENMLFATLDPTTRKLKLPNHGECLITDTVGFINRLPHHLVEAFKSTLDEVVYSDLILVTMDASDPHFRQKYQITKTIITSLFEKRKEEVGRMLFVLNKCDLPESKFNIEGFEEDNVKISAKSGAGIDELISKIESIIAENKHNVTLKLPYSMSQKLDSLYKTSKIESVDYETDGIIIKCVLDNKDFNMLSKYIEN